MKFIPDIWKTMSARAINPTFDGLLALGSRVGWKAKKGEAKLPAEMVRQMLLEAYQQGAQAALRMAEEVDGEIDQPDTEPEVA